MSKYQQMLEAQWQELAYCLALVERMYPNYALFSEVSDFGDAKVLRNAIDVLWGEVAGHVASVDFGKQLEKLEAVTPEITDFDSYGVRPATDACVALSQLLDVFALHEPLSIGDIDRIEQSTLASYIELIGYTAEDRHPLLQDSEAFSAEIKHQLRAPGGRKDAVAGLRSYCRLLPSSNIGIDCS